MRLVSLMNSVLVTLALVLLSVFPCICASASASSEIHYENDISTATHYEDEGNNVSSYSGFPSISVHDLDLPDIIEILFQRKRIIDIKSLIEDDPYLLTRPIKNGLYLIHMATRAGLYSLLKDLIEIYGCDVNKITEDGQEMSPLHLAVTDFSDSTSHIINFLIESGAVVDALNVFGETPLYYAVIFDNTEAVKVLLEKGADPHISIRDPATYHQVRLVANMAVMSGSLDIINTLLDHNVDLTLTDTSMINALHMTVITRNLPIYKRLNPLHNMHSNCGTPCEAPEAVSRQIYRQAPMIMVSSVGSNNDIVAKKYCNISICDDTFALSALND